MYQTRKMLEAMSQDTGVAFTELRTNGGMFVNDLLMQFQADILDVPVVRPKVSETTALGAAYAAGIAVAQWSEEDIRKIWAEDKTWTPNMDEAERERRYAEWNAAVERAY